MRRKRRLHYIYKHKNNQFMLTVKKFGVRWCQPCLMLAPIFEEVKKENPNVRFVDIDVDDNKDLAIQSGVQSVPTIIFEKDGQQVHRFSGVKPKSVVNSIIKQYL